MLVEHQQRKKCDKSKNAINNSDIYDTYKYLYLCEKGIQSANGLKAWASEIEEVGTTIIPISKENLIKIMISLLKRKGCLQLYKLKI